MSETLLGQNHASDKTTSTGRFLDIRVNGFLLDIIAGLPATRQRSEEARAQLKAIDGEGEERWRRYRRSDRSPEVVTAYTELTRLDEAVEIYRDRVAAIRQAGERAARELRTRIPLPGIANIGSRSYWTTDGGEGRKVLITSDGESEEIIKFGETQSGLDYPEVKAAELGDYIILLTDLAAEQASTHA